MNKVLVTHQNEPKGMFEDWRVLPGEGNKRIGEVGYSNVAFSHSGSDLGDALKKLREATAVVVTGPSTNEIKGVITGADLLKAFRSSRETESLTS